MSNPVGLQPLHTGVSQPQVVPQGAINQSNPGPPLNSSSTQFPAIDNSQVPVPPGLWAQRATSLVWKCAYRSNQLKTALLQYASTLPAQREPTVRFERGWTPAVFEKLISERKMNVEAVLAQTVGTVATTPCDCCARNSGPFTICVILPGSGMTECASCHWASGASRCSFNHQATTAVTTTTTAVVAAPVQATQAVTMAPQPPTAPVQAGHAAIMAPQPTFARSASADDSTDLATTDDDAEWDLEDVSLSQRLEEFRTIIKPENIVQARKGVKSASEKALKEAGEQVLVLTKAAKFGADLDGRSHIMAAANELHQTAFALWSMAEEVRRALK
ncbi:hypothetical protein N7454_000917 [Penicillium verhagenii]|nr:hypothetical protein N7454_000917 [Penicillium verhagenii]